VDVIGKGVTLSPRSPARWYHGWNIVAVCIIMQGAGLGVMANCFSFFLEDWSATFRVPVSTMVLAITLFSFPCAFLAPVAGWVVARFSVRRVMLLGMATVAAGYIGIGFTQHAWQVIAVFVVVLPVGITFSSSITAQSLVSRWFVRRRGLAFSLSATGLVVAGVLYPPLVVALNQALGWRWTWWLSGAFNLVVVCALILLVIRDRPRPDETAYGAGEQEHEHAPADAPELTLRDILSRRNFWIALAGYMPPLMANNAMSVNFAPFAANRGASIAETAALLATFSIAAAVGKLGCGMLADRYGDRIPLMLLGVSSALGLGILVVAGSFVPLAIGFVLLAFGQGAWVMLASCIASEFGARGFSRAYGVASFSSLIGTIPAPLVAWSAEVHHTYVPAVLTFAAGSCAAAGASLLFRDAPRFRRVRT